MNTNRVLLIGYLGHEITTKTFENGIKRVAMRIATNKILKNEKGESRLQATWHTVVAWDKLAEFAANGFVKGSKILVDGSLHYKSFKTAAGINCRTMEVKAHTLMNLDR